MKIIGCNFTKLSGTKLEKVMKPTLETNIVFKSLEKEKSELQGIDEVIRISFSYELLYKNSENKSKSGEILVEGDLFLTISKEESKEIWKSWKKKELPQQMRMMLFNFILRKATPKAVFFEEEVGLPSHIPIPKVDFSKENNK